MQNTNRITIKKPRCALCQQKITGEAHWVNSEYQSINFCDACWENTAWEVDLWKTKQSIEHPMPDWMRTKHPDLYEYMQTITRLNNRIKRLEDKK